MKDNIIFNTILENRTGHYCHALEVASSYEIENAIESMWSEFEYIATIEDLKDFFNSIELYYYEEDEDGQRVDDKANEEEVYNFNIDESINNLTI